MYGDKQSVYRHHSGNDRTAKGRRSDGARWRVYRQRSEVRLAQRKIEEIVLGNVNTQMLRLMIAE
jgi:hypothetical protein